MSTHCSGCGSAEMALEFLRVAMADCGMTVPLDMISACVCDLAGVGQCSTALVPCGKLRMWIHIVSRFS